MKKLSLHLTSMLEAKNRESALALRRPVEAKGNIEKEATLLKAKHKNNELKIKVRLAELQTLDEKCEKQAEVLEKGDMDKNIEDKQREIEELKRDLISLKREQTGNGRKLIKKETKTKLDADFITKVEKLSHEINQVRAKVEEERNRHQKVQDNIQNIRDLIREENIQLFALKQKYDSEIDFDELEDKNLEETEKRYWRLLGKKTMIEDHMKSVENSTTRLRIVMKKELVNIENENKQLREELEHQKKAMQDQKVRLAEAEEAFAKNKEKIVEELEKVSSDIHYVNSRERGDNSPLLLPSKARKEGIKFPRQGSSESKDNPNTGGMKESRDNFITIHFDENKDNKAKKGPVPPISEAEDDKKIMQQVNSYEMDSNTKAFLENYLKDDPEDKTAESPINEKPKVKLPQAG